MKELTAVPHLVLLFGIAFAVWRREIFLKKIFWPTLGVKLIAGIALGLLYKYYYSVGDTFGYFEDGANIAALARTNFSKYVDFLWSGNDTYAIWPQLNFHEPRALFLTKMVSLLNLISFDNYWIDSIYFSFFSYLCSWYLVKTMVHNFPELHFSAVIAFLFFPSVVFWSSGLIKESLAMASLFWLSAMFLKIWMKNKISFWVWISFPISVWLLWNLKYYYAAVFIPVAGTSLLMKYIFVPLAKPKNAAIEIAGWFVVFLAPLFIVSLLHPNFYPERFLQVIVENYNVFLKISPNPEKLIHYHNLQASGSNMALNAPWALFSGLFRPFLWESENVLQLLVSLENIILLLLFITSLTGLIKMRSSSHRLIFLSLMVYIIILCVFLSLSTPNFGTLSRYRVGFLPFFIFIIIIQNPLVNWATGFIQRSFPNLVR